jgi:predicted nucleotidyltransferase
MIVKLIKRVCQRLDEDEIPYMIIGGQAVLIYGRPRLTYDIDITLGVDTDKFQIIEKVCRKLRLRILPEDPETFAKETKVLPAEEPRSRIRLDFIFSCTAYETQAIKRAKEISIYNYAVKFASCEDVIIHKMLAGRAIDEEDVKSILAKNRSSLNLKYVRRWISEFGRISEHNNVLQRFNGLVRQYDKE